MLCGAKMDSQFLKKLYNKLPTLAFDILCIPLAWFFAFWIRFNMSAMPVGLLERSVIPCAILMLVQTACYYHFKTYRGAWHFTSLSELLIIIKSVFFATVLSVPLLYLFSVLSVIPRSVLPLYTFSLIGLLCMGRVGMRLLKESALSHHSMQNAKRVLIIGAGSGGERLCRDMQRQKGGLYQAIGFLDDNKRKKGIEIHGVRVLGAISELKEIITRHNIDIIFIAMPSVKAKELRRIYQYCEGLNLNVRTLPSLKDIASGNISVNTLRDISIEDLLGRAQVELDWSRISDFVKGKRVLVTGGGGSIGSELCRQVAKLQPLSVAILDNSEFNLYEIGYELRASYPKLDIIDALVNVTDRLAVKETMEGFKPDIVFHAAAFKHVPLLENQIRIAAQNNVLGTKTVAEEAANVGAEKFILISTDKAVKPTNIMGTTKRVAEIFCQNYNTEVKTEFITVRFGNVLGSMGSVVPLFKKQLEKGLPLTVTHPDITRYFMTIPEACQLILQASVLGKGGEIFVLDMGEPIKIKYLAEQMIRLSGKEPYVDVEINYIGLRPGEKLYEELFHNLEVMTKTEHIKILKANHREVPWEALLTDLDSVESLSKRGYADDDLLLLLGKMVPEYQGDNVNFEKKVSA
jgi:FlaA1/EpsC-like NDP-sugar epimerase